MPHTHSCPKCAEPFTGRLTVGNRAQCSGCGTTLVVRLEIALG